MLWVYHKHTCHQKRKPKCYIPGQDLGGREGGVCVWEWGGWGEIERENELLRTFV